MSREKLHDGKVSKSFENDDKSEENYIKGDYIDTSNKMSPPGSPTTDQINIMDAYYNKNPDMVYDKKANDICEKEPSLDYGKYGIIDEPIVKLDSSGSKHDSDINVSF